MGKNDKKGADKSGGKSKATDKDAGGKSKGAQSINVRHILVRRTSQHSPHHQHGSV
jgi:NIMA-interacting peptidyl-prolyl cis-trans isomerase 4